MDHQLVSIQSVPRSGSSWLGQIFRSSVQVAFRYQPLFSYAFKGRLDERCNRKEILEFFEEIRRTDDDFVLQQDAAIHVDHPVVHERDMVSHIVMKEVRYNHIIRNMLEQVPELKVIGLVRHPCAVLDSWINAPREFEKQWNLQEEWRSGARKNQDRPEEFFGFDKWKEVAQLFIDLEQEYPDQMKVVRYADLNADPQAVVKEIFTFCDLPFEAETEAFILESRNTEGNDTYSVYRKAREDVAWKSRLPKPIADEILEEVGSCSLSRFLV